MLDAGARLAMPIHTSRRVVLCCQSPRKDCGQTERHCAPECQEFSSLTNHRLTNHVSMLQFAFVASFWPPFLSASSLWRDRNKEMSKDRQVEVDQTFQIPFHTTRKKIATLPPTAMMMHQWRTSTIASNSVKASWRGTNPTKVISFSWPKKLKYRESLFSVVSSI